jgi:hypothetical protein
MSLYPAGQFGMIQVALTVTPGLPIYPLPNDFGKLVSVRMLIADSWVPLEPLDVTAELILLSTRSWDYARVKYLLMRSSSLSAGIEFFPPPAAAYSLQIFYLQTAPFFDSDGATSWLGEDEYLVLDCCIKCAAKQEQDATVFLQQKSAYQQRLEQQTMPLDAGRGPTVQDVMSSASREDIWWFRR